YLNKLSQIFGDNEINGLQLQNNEHRAQLKKERQPVYPMVEEVME
ncbi:1044_t:CDS:1, partial [Paraglomus occultum]